VFFDNITVTKLRFQNKQYFENILKSLRFRQKIYIINIFYIIKKPLKKVGEEKKVYHKIFYN